jgi:hypothetical protein
LHCILSLPFQAETKQNRICLKVGALEAVHQSMSWCIRSIILLILWSISGTSLIGIFGAINIHFIANSKLQGLSTLLCQWTRVKLTHWQVIYGFFGWWFPHCVGLFCGLSPHFFVGLFPKNWLIRFFLNSSFEERSSTWARPLRRRSRLNLQGFFFQWNMEGKSLSHHGTINLVIFWTWNHPFWASNVVQLLTHPQVGMSTKEMMLEGEVT